MNIQTVWQTYIDSRQLDIVNLKKEVSRFNCHLLPYWEDKKLKNLKFNDIILFRTYLENKNLSPQSVKHCLSLLKRILNRAKQLDIFVYDIPHFEMPKINNQRTRFLTDSEIKQLLYALRKRSKLWHDISLFALHTGMRANEIFLLKVSSINLYQRTVTIFKTKSHRSRIIHLNDVSYMVAKEYHSKNMKYLFSDEKIKQPSKIFRQTIKELKFNDSVDEIQDRVVFHTLRHTFASQLMQRGLPLEVVSKLLGHSSLSMTMRYAHLSPHQGINAVNLLTDLSVT